jgi:hypothetical protein
MDRRLYDEDFYLWTAAQADALRAEGKRQTTQSNAVDWDLLAEEIEDLGKRDRNEVWSLTTQIIVHLFKLAWSRADAPTGHWRAEVLAFRQTLLGVLTPSLRAKALAELENLHIAAARRAALTFRDLEPSAPTDASLRWSLAEILGEENDPIA